MPPTPSTPSHSTILETILIGLVLAGAAVLTYFGGTVFEHLGESTVGGRVLALPLLVIGVILGHDYPPDAIRGVVYIGGFLAYFFAGLWLLNVVQNQIRSWLVRSRGGGSGSGPRIVI